jgi:hypothetical protein
LTTKAPYKPAPAKAGVIDGEKGIIALAEADLRPLQLLLDEAVAVEVVVWNGKNEATRITIGPRVWSRM